MDEPNWQPLALLGGQFDANLDALRSHDASLAHRLTALQSAHEYCVAGAEQQVLLGRATQGRIESLPNPITPAAARQIAMKLFPAGQCTEPVLVAGLDQGW